MSRKDRKHPPVNSPELRADFFLYDFIKKPRSDRRSVRGGTIVRNQNDDFLLPAVGMV